MSCTLADLTQVVLSIDPITGLSQEVERETSRPPCIVLLIVARGDPIQGGLISLEGRRRPDTAWERVGGIVGTERLTRDEPTEVFFDTSANRYNESLHRWEEAVPGPAWDIRTFRARFTRPPMNRFRSSGWIELALAI